jgi:hypothetical protein
VNDSPAPPTYLTMIARRSRVLPLIGFAAFVAIALPLAICTCSGVWIDSLLWTVPFVAPLVLSVFRLGVRGPESEAARQAADISRWDV